MPYELPSCECVMGQSPNIAELLKNIYCAVYAGGAGGGLPDMAGHAGEFLTNNGSEASWAAIPGGGDVLASGTLTLNQIIIGQGGTTVAAASTAAGVLTFLATPSSANLRSMVTDESGTGALLFQSGALGTPASGTLSSCTGLPITTGVSGLGANVATFLATPSSANLAAAVSDETGSGLLVFGTAPVFASNITVGTAGGTTGAVLLRGTTSGTVTLTTAAAAGTWTLQLPAVDGDNGQVLTTDGAGVTSWQTPAAGSSLTATQVGFGSAGNALTGSANFTFIVASGLLTIDNGAGNGLVGLGNTGVLMTGSNGTLTIAGGGGGSNEDLVFDFDSTANTVEVTSTTGVTLIDFSTIGLATDNADITNVSVTTSFLPATSDTVSLGDATHQWSDLFLAEGAVINWDGGDATITQTANDITFGGISTLTLGATTALTAGTGTFAATTSLLLGTAGSAVGNVGFRNATSGTITLAPTTGALGTVTQTLQAVTGTILCTGGTDVPVADGGTGLSSGTSGGVLAFTAAGTLASSAALAANAIVLGGGAGAVPATTTTGTGVVTALGVNVGSAGAFVVNGGALGTPSSGTLTNCTGLPASGIAAGVLGGNITLGESTGQIILDPTLSADGTWSGIMQAGTAGATLAFGDLIYLAAADSRWELADADAASTSGDVVLGICVLAAAADGDPTNVLLYGKIRADAAFPTLTIGAPAYVGTTAGDIQVAQPSGTDDVIRVVGHGLTADVLLFNPDGMYITHT